MKPFAQRLRLRSYDRFSVFREGTTGRHRHAIGVAVRVPEGQYAAEPPETVVDPAADTRLVVRVDNRSTSAELLELTVEGMPAGWAEVFPRTIHVPASEQREADVIVNVPHAAEIRAAEWPLRVVAYARGRRVGSAPARVRVAPHAVVSLELHPRDLRARGRAHAEVRVRNAGDAAADIELSAATGDDAEPTAPPLTCSVSPSRVHVEPGEEAVAQLEVRTPRRWLRRGEAVPVVVTTHGARAEGTFRPRAAVPVWAFIVPVLAAAFGAWLAARPNQVSVPRVTGLSVPEARDKLREAGLEPKQAPLRVEQTSEAGGVVRQDPPAGTQLADGSDVTLSYYQGQSVGTVTPQVSTSQVGPAPEDQEPVAFTRANRVFVQFPGEGENAVGGTVGELTGDPAWDPRTGELAYVRRAASSSTAEIVAVDPHAPGTPRPLVEGAGSYTSPAFAPDGSRLALIAEDGSGYGGSLCVVVPPALAPRCQHDPDWRYGRPVFSPDGALYALRRSTGTTREGGYDELVRVNTDLLAEGEPLARGDLRGVATSGDGRFGVLARRTGEVGYHTEVLSPTGATVAQQTGDASACDIAWGGGSLVVSSGACGSAETTAWLDPANLDGTPTKLLDGGDPAVVG